jgi:hypothetical protein
MLRLDHLAISAESLKEGGAWVEEQFGVPLQAGGRHSHFGTHNLLLGLADGLYLEVIAIDPTAPPLPHPRWFDLDRFSGPPRVSNWIARTDDLAQACLSLPGLGQVVPLERGDLRWEISVPEDGTLPRDGGFPTAIRWQGAAHPIQRLTPQPVALERLTIRHPHALELAETLLPLLQDARVDFSEADTAGISALFKTPKGLVSL